MKNIKQTFRFPRFLSIIFVVQFLIFVIYSINNEEDILLLIASIVIFIIGLFLFFAKFNLQINESGINYSLFPFVKKRIEWNEINTYEINRISALGDFLGWGIRFSKKYGLSYIFNSDYGLTIVKQNGKKMTFSIENQTEVDECMKKYLVKM